MRHVRHAVVGAALPLFALAACDDDPSGPVADFQVSCPTGPVAVNAPLSFTFSGPVAAASLTSANVVISDAVTGVEIPGTLNRTSGGTTVEFVQADPFPYDRMLRVRIQNVLRDTTNEVVPLTVCEFLTVLPPITQLWWDPLPAITGVPIRAASLVRPDSGYVMNIVGTVFRTRASAFEVVFNEPYYQDGRDVAFIDLDTGFTSHLDVRARRFFILRTNNSAATWDTVFSDTYSEAITRVRAERIGNQEFAVAGGGGGPRVQFWKHHSPTGTWSRVTGDATYTNVMDIDWRGNDTTFLAAASEGFRFGLFEKFGAVWTSSDGGTTWSRIANADADTINLTYHGVSVRSSNEVWVSGGSGYVKRLTRTGGAGPWTVARIPLSAFGLTNPDSTDPRALIFTDIQFAPDNAAKGWLVGAIRTGVVNGVPQYTGLIYETTDGGTTWTRQGVRGAEDFGASFPALRRIDVFDQNNVWIVGDAGFAISYQP